MDRWHGLANLYCSLKYWSEIQISLAGQGNFRVAAPLYGMPFLSGSRLVIPRGPGTAEDSDGYTDYSIVDEEHYFSIQTSGRTRGDTFSETAEGWFGTFNDAAKFFLGRQVASTTRLRVRSGGLEVVNWRWSGRGLAPLWSEVSAPNPNGFIDSKRYFRSDDPGRFYVTLNPDTATSFLLELSWRELNATFTEGIPGIEHVRMPEFSDD
ncbi:hypothetical protein GDN83_02145 [Gordonia jinghuaiqii]|nr:hypothetical protein [Gordonia jinghuaiqii]